MKVFFRNIIFFFLGLFSVSALNAQDKLSTDCDRFLSDGYVSDGQEYRAKLDENNKAKFFATFYGGSNYRIIGCSNIKKYPLIITVYDAEKNLLFCNKDYNYSAFWNFTFTSTIDCIIELEFDVETHIKNEVLLLIGFKEK